MPDVLHHLFGLVCGQHPAHTWAFGDALLPFCQRCTGLYAGAAFGLTLHLVLRPRPSSGLLWFHGLLLLQMAPQGFHLAPQTPLLRLVSGHLFGIGVVAYLWLMAAPGRRPHPDNRAAGDAPYVAGVAASLALLVALVYAGGPGVGPALSGVGLLGLVGCVSLVLIGVVRALGSIRPAGRRVTS